MVAKTPSSDTDARAARVDFDVRRTPTIRVAGAGEPVGADEDGPVLREPSQKLFEQYLEALTRILSQASMSYELWNHADVSAQEKEKDDRDWILVRND